MKLRAWAAIFALVPLIGLGLYFWHRSDRETIARETCSHLITSIANWHRDFLSGDHQLPNPFPKNLPELKMFGYLDLGNLSNLRNKVGIEYIAPSTDISSDTLIVRVFTGYHIYSGYYGGRIVEAQK